METKRRTVAPCCRANLTIDTAMHAARGSAAGISPREITRQICLALWNKISRLYIYPCETQYSTMKYPAPPVISEFGESPAFPNGRLVASSPKVRDSNMDGNQRAARTPKLPCEYMLLLRLRLVVRPVQVKTKSEICAQAPKHSQNNGMGLTIDQNWIPGRVPGDLQKRFWLMGRAFI